MPPESSRYSGNLSRRGKIVSDPKVRRESIVAHVRERARVPLAEVVRWVATRWHCSDSTAYDDIARLVAHRKLQRIPTGHGDVLTVPSALQVADPALVRDRAKCVLNSRLTNELRTACAADLLRLSEKTDVLPDDSLLKLFQAGVKDQTMPGRSSTIDTLRNVAKRTAAHDISSVGPQSPDADAFDWPEALAKLQRQVGSTLLEQIERDIGNASWACEILVDLWAGRPEDRLVRELLQLALTKAHPMPSFEAALPVLARVIGGAIASNGREALKNAVRLALDQALNSPNGGIRDQARMLRNELRQALLP